MTETAFLKVFFPLSTSLLCSLSFCHSRGFPADLTPRTWPKTWKGRGISAISTPQWAHPYSPNTVRKRLRCQGLEQIENSDSQNADGGGGTREGAVSDFSFALLTEFHLAVDERSEQPAVVGSALQIRVGSLEDWQERRNWGRYFCYSMPFVGGMSCLSLLFYL